MSKTPVYLFSTSSYPNTIHINSLQITFLKPKINFEEYDYIIVTSKQISHALQAYDKKQYIEKKFLCISQQSANSLKSLGCDILTTGEGYGDDLSRIIQSYSKETRWLYLRAKEVASNFRDNCVENGYSIDEKIVYESQCSPEMNNLDIQENATLIFTSPSSIRCFLLTNSFTKNHKIIVIGKTTAKVVDSKFNCMVSKTTTIKSCLDLV